jgi:integrase
VAIVSTGTAKRGWTRVVSIDHETVAVLRQRKADWATEQLKAGDSCRGTRDGNVFTTGWGEPFYPDTVTSLMTKLIRASKPLPHARLHDLGLTVLADRPSSPSASQSSTAHCTM